MQAVHEQFYAGAGQTECASGTNCAQSLRALHANVVLDAYIQKDDLSGHRKRHEEALKIVLSSDHFHRDDHKARHMAAMAAIHANIRDPEAQSRLIKTLTDANSSLSDSVSRKEAHRHAVQTLQQCLPDVDDTRDAHNAAMNAVHQQFYPTDHDPDISHLIENDMGTEDHVNSLSDIHTALHGHADDKLKELAKAHLLGEYLSSDDEILDSSRYIEESDGILEDDRVQEMPTYSIPITDENDARSDENDARMVAEAKSLLSKLESRSSKIRRLHEQERQRHDLMHETKISEGIAATRLQCCWRSRVATHEAKSLRENVSSEQIDTLPSVQPREISPRRNSKRDDIISGRRFEELGRRFEEKQQRLRKLRERRQGNIKLQSVEEDLNVPELPPPPPPLQPKNDASGTPQYICETSKQFEEAKMQWQRNHEAWKNDLKDEMKRTHAAELGDGERMFSSDGGGMQDVVQEPPSEKYVGEEGAAVSRPKLEVDTKISNEISSLQLSPEVLASYEKWGHRVLPIRVQRKLGMEMSSPPPRPRELYAWKRKVMANRASETGSIRVPLGSPKPKVSQNVGRLNEGEAAHVSDEEIDAKRWHPWMQDTFVLDPMLSPSKHVNGRVYGAAAFAGSCLSPKSPSRRAWWEDE
jgi:hypothetical protein